MTISQDDPRLDAAARMRQLVADGSQVPISVNSLPYNRIYRSVDEMYRMANVYYDESSLDKALTLYLRFVTMHLEHLPQHPEHGRHREDSIRSRKKLQAAMQRAEQLKPELKSQYEEEAAELRKQLENERAEREAVLAASAASAAITAAALPSAPFGSDSHFPTANTDGIEYPDFENVEPKNSGLYDLGSGDMLPQGPRPDSGHVAPIPPPRPSVDRSKKPATDQVQDWDYSGGLRRVIVPYSVVDAFMRCAAENTAKNVETCGILCAKLQANAFVISHCVIPKQSGTPDSCTTMEEHEVFEIQDSFDLITVGWIHTHPTQTAFLSSVDMHTHYAYQVMLAESVAVVCSPKYEQFGLFKLSAAGMRQIGSCREQGFHPHDKDPPLFQSCEHSSIEQNYTGEVIDLR